MLEESRDRPFLRQHSIREEAVKHLTVPEIVDRTEHVLSPLAPLREPNTREIKRLVNAYSVNRALSTFALVNIERDTLAIWTILSLQHLALATYLESHPDMVTQIGEDPPEAVDDAVSELFTDEPVVDIVRD